MEEPTQPTMTNQSRIDAAQRAIDAHVGYNEQSAEECIIDLLTDLRHLCEAEDVDFTRAIRMSKVHFEEEGE